MPAVSLPSNTPPPPQTPTVFSLVVVFFALLLFGVHKVHYIRRHSTLAHTFTSDYKKPVMSLIEEPSVLKDNKYPAKLHNRTIWQNLQKKLPSTNNDNIFWLIGSNEVEPNKYCDTTKPFRQERYFYYMSGCNLPSSFIMYQPMEDKLILFLDNIDQDDIMWSGLPISLDEAKLKYDVDEVKYVSELFDYVGELIADKDTKTTKIYTTDLDAWFKFKDQSKIVDKLIPNDKTFFWAMDESRLIKDKYEIECIRHACHITDNSHLMCMSKLHIEQNEYHLQAEFQYHSMRNGSRSLGYDSICGSNESCGVLHYIHNDQSLLDKESVLIDMGCEWNNYTSDVTRCFSPKGKFTDKHLTIYQIVLKMQRETMKLIKPGASWENLHLLSHKILINEFIKIGIIKDNHTQEEILNSRLSCAFYPHGLGHLMGLDVHDVGGLPNYNDPDPMFKYLRLRRLLMANMVVTVEPGCYFNKFLIDEFVMKDPLKVGMINWDTLNEYMYLGGVRIEDDVLVTRDGYENLTKITSDPFEIERIVTDGLNES